MCLFHSRCYNFILRCSKSSTIWAGDKHREADLGLWCHVTLKDIFLASGSMVLCLMFLIWSSLETIWYLFSSKEISIFIHNMSLLNSMMFIHYIIVSIGIMISQNLSLLMVWKGTEETLSHLVLFMALFNLIWLFPDRFWWLANSYLSFPWWNLWKCCPWLWELFFWFYLFIYF